MNKIFNFIRECSLNNKEVTFISDPKSLKIFALCDEDKVEITVNTLRKHYNKIFNNCLVTGDVLSLFYHEDLIISRSGSNKNIHKIQYTTDADISYIDTLKEYNGCYAALAKSSWVCKKDIINKYVIEFKNLNEKYIKYFVLPLLFTNDNFNGNYVPELEDIQLNFVKERHHLLDRIKFRYESVQNYIDLISV
jgi:hypothetical protein